MEKKYYNSETGDVEDDEQQGAIPVEPLRVPGIVEQFMATYIPAVDEKTADIVMDMGGLRSELVSWMPFGAKEDPLADYLEQLADNGYIMQQTASGPALCLMLKGGQRVVTVPSNSPNIGDRLHGWTEAEEVKSESEQSSGQLPLSL